MKKKLTSTTAFILKGEKKEKAGLIFESEIIDDICADSNFNVTGISFKSGSIEVTLEEKSPKNYNDVRKSQLEAIKINLGLAFDTEFEINKEYFIRFDISNMNEKSVKETVETILEKNRYFTKYNVDILDNTLIISYTKEVNETDQYFTAQGLIIKNRIEKALKVIFI